MRRFAVAVILLALGIGCGRSGPPTGPSASSGATGLSGATVRGTISGPSASSSGASVAAVSAAMAGLSVSVVGTSLSATVDSSNSFSLQGVPPGDQQLRFLGAGVDAKVNVPAVQTTETIDMTVTVSGTSATIESQARGAAGQIEIEGRIEALPPLTPAGSFVIRGQTVQTNGSTQFMRGDQAVTFAALEIGLRAHVKATSNGGSLLAALVEIQNTNTDLPVEINGIIKEFSGSVGNFQFKIDGRLIKGDAATELFGGTVFSDIQNERRAEVKGLQKNGYVYASRLKVNDASDDQDQSASIEGILTSNSGGAFPTLVVDGTTVMTNAGTVVRRRGDVQDLSVLQIGMTVHVEGIRAINGSITARMIQIKDDETGDLVQIEGSMGGVSGSCPTISFGVNGYSIFTDGSTTFVPSCPVLKSGTKVKVNGTKQADGRFKASSVEKQ